MKLVYVICALFTASMYSVTSTTDMLRSAIEKSTSADQIINIISKNARSFNSARETTNFIYFMGT